MPRLDLDALFDEWLKSYPETKQRDFHRDGIVNPGCYARERIHLLFVLAEPNSMDGRYDRYRGVDLRKIFGEIGLGKSVDHNLARWTSVLLDRRTDYRPHTSGGDPKEHLRRVAVMNMKKTAGSGVANREAVSVQAWRDRRFIRQEIEIIAPTVVVACGETVNRLLCWIIKDDPFLNVEADEVWRFGQVPVLPANHPSVRPIHAADAFMRVVQRAKGARLGAFE